MAECLHRATEGLHPRDCALTDRCCTQMFYWGQPAEQDVGYHSTDSCAVYLRHRADAAKKQAYYADWAACEMAADREGLLQLLSQAQYDLTVECNRAEAAEARIVSLLYELGMAKDRAEAWKAMAGRLAEALSVHHTPRPRCKCRGCVALIEYEDLKREMGEGT